MKIRLFPIAIAEVCFVLLLATAHAQVPQLINYQGRIVVGSTNFTGTGSFKFALVNATGTTAYWTNDGTHLNGTEPTNAVSVSVSNGLFSVLLGDTSLTNMTAVPATVFNNADVRLRIWFDDGTHGSEQLGPDQRIAAVGYAVIAGNVPNGAITSAKMANGAVGSPQLANGAVTSVKIDTATVQRRVTGSAPAGQFIQSINADGTIVASGLIPAGSSTQLQFNNGGVFGGLANVKYNTTKNSLTLFGDIPSDLGSSMPGSNGGKLTILGTGADKPAIAIVGDYRSGTSGERYASILGANGLYASNGPMQLTAIPYPKAFPSNSLIILTDVPTAQINYSPYNQGAGGKIFQGAGIGVVGDNAPIVFDLTSQGRLTLSNWYDSFNSPQLLIEDVSSSSSGTHKTFGLRARNNELRIGAWEPGNDDFAAPYNGQLTLSDSGVDITGNNLTVRDTQYSGRIYFGDTINGVGIGMPAGQPITVFHGFTNAVVPDTDDTMSLGSTSKRWKDFYTSAGIHPGSMSDSSAANNTLYFSTTQNKLAYKDSGGTVHVLY